MINSGYKVGVVTQQETAALKKSSTNKSGPFTRALTSVFTSSTFIDELDVDDSVTGGSNPSTLVCIVEQVGKGGKEEKTKLGLIGVMPSTGEIVYDGKSSPMLIYLVSLIDVCFALKISKMVICDQSSKPECSICNRVN